MGEKVSRVLEINNPGYIEYSHKGCRTELLDLYLTAHCDFFFSCSTGLDSLADVFRQPILYVNLVPLQNINAWSPRSLSIFKKYRLVREKRFLTLREMLSAGRLMETDEFAKRGIEPVENTPEEIREAAMEMHARLKGNWQESPEDKELQEHFWSFFKPNELNRVFRSRIGARFLRQNSYLLQ
jgi:putative glycosyltransferase (TIGR04372 family)